MNAREGFDFDGLHCFQSPDDAELFYYVPGDPGPEVDAQNRPTLLMLVSSTGAILQLGAHWKAEADRLEALRNELVKRHPDIDPGAIRLSASAAAVQKVTVGLGDGSGRFEELQSSASSGFPPFTAIFNIRLTGEQKDRAIAALNGRSGFLRIAYLIRFTSDVSIEVVISGDVKADLEALSADATLEDCRARVSAGLDNGHLTQEVSENGPVPAEMKAKALTLAAEKAAEMLQSMVQQVTAPAPVSVSQLRVSAALSDTAVRSEERATDVSTWFPGGAGPDHVRPIGGNSGGPGPGPGPKAGQTVAFDFGDRTDLPVAFVEAARGATKAVLRPPAFEPATLAGPESQEALTVTTNYTDGGPPYRATLAQPEAGGWKISLAQLGLQRVVIDGTARHAAGARELRVRAQYRPTGNGTDEDRTIYLRNDIWVQAFFVVTRDASIAGALAFDWQETGADGSIRSGRIETPDPSLKLT